MTDNFDLAAQQLVALLPSGPRLGILGSTDFWHADSERTCFALGQQLLAIPDLVLLTGGVEGIGEAVGRSYFQACRAAAREPHVFHILPQGEEPWDYGVTLFAGADMTERREILGRLCKLFVMIEGGPRAGHEADIAHSHGAIVIPVARSCGYAATLYSQVQCPPAIDLATWSQLAASEATPEGTANAVLRAVLTG